ncbi:MAG: FtsX-like permease family protein [Cyclobacteriaceae bacterium]
MNKVPPEYPLRFFRWFCNPDYVEDIEGDLLERFEKRKEEGKSARWLFISDVFRLFRPGIIKNFEGAQQLNYYGMFKHNLLVTFRGFMRHRSTFLINLMGLSTGLATVLLIYLWVNDEMSVDRFNAKDDQLYRAMTHFKLPESINTWDYTTGRLAESMLADFPEVKEAVRVGNSFFRPDGVISFKDSHLEIDGLFAGKNLFEVMTYPLIVGDQRKVLEKKESVVVSKKLAEKLFGTTEAAIGKTVSWNNRLFSKDLIVSGVFAGVPENATIQFEAVINYDILIDRDPWADDWKGGYAETYLVLEKGTDIEEFNKKIAGYIKEKAQQDPMTLFVQKYSDRYLFGEYDQGILTGGRIDNVRLFLVIAAFILLIACINFMNLATAQSSIKMKEIGVKKAIGVDRRDLVIQFLGESVILSLISLVVGLILVISILPVFNEITGKVLTLDLNQHLPVLVGISLLTGILSGSYPAFYLSTLKSVTMLRGKSKVRKSEGWIRKGLVIVQFTLSIVFFVGIIIVNRQISYTLNRNLGYDRSDVISFVRKGTDLSESESFVNELNEISGVKSASNMAGSFLWGDDNGSGYSWNGEESNEKHLFKSPKIGFDVIETLGLEIDLGRSFSRAFNDDNNKIILNESAVKMMGLENPVGTRIKNGPEFYEIVGVVKDFQYGSLHQEIEPLIFRFREWGRNYLVKINRGSELQALEQIEEVYKKFHPLFDFEASFLDDDYQALYQSEQDVANLSNYMTAIALIISCLGLFGLATFTIERKVKEIGIRKVLGCRARKIVFLLSWDFTKMVIVAILIAVPLSYYAGASWLENFAYHIDIAWWYFLVAGVSALLISWITVGTQTIRAALANPVESLKDE